MVAHVIRMWNQILLSIQRVASVERGVLYRERTTLSTKRFRDGMEEWYLSQRRYCMKAILLTGAAGRTGTILRNHWYREHRLIGVDITSEMPIRPDSLYGVSKAFG